MRVLITGGAGFIGSHLTEKHLNDGDEVYVIDDYSTGCKENLDRIVEKNPEFKKRLFITENTILNRDVMLELVGTCEMVYHLAAAVGVQYILDNPLSSIITNIQGTEIVLDLCAKFKKKVLIASTSEVYGKRTLDDKSKLSETDDCIYGPSIKSRWSYAGAKLMDEFTALAYFRTKQLPVVIVRFFNTVGPRQTGRYGMVIPRFVNQALNNKPITIYGEGTQTRTFTHVKEVVESIHKLTQTPDAYGQVVNVGGVEEVSITELAERIKKKTNSTSEISYTPYDQAYPKDFEDMQRRVPSTEKLKNIIGFAPQCRLDGILDDVIEDARN